MRRTRKTILSFAVILSIWIPASLAAQSAAIPLCRVTGIVHNQSQQPVAGATVQLAPQGGGQSYTASTDAGGRYCLRGVAPGGYTIHAAKFGLAMDAPAGAGLTVTVTGSPAPVTRNIQMHVVVHIIESLSGGQTKGIATHPQPTATPLPPPPLAPTATPPVEPARHEHAAETQPTPQQPAQQQPAQQQSQDDIGEAEAKWFDQLKTGAIQYNVPAQMTIGEASAVSVTISGYQAPAPQPAGPDSTTAPLKVSNFMRVTLTQDDNPDEFTVVHGQNADEQFVPISGSASWSWTVTPKHLGKNLKLRLQAFVLYQDPKLGIQQSFPAASRDVTVVAEGIKGIASDARDSFWSDPQVWIKYMLPGGAGFAALAAIVGWWVKRKKPDAAKDAPKDK